MASMPVSRSSSAGSRFFACWKPARCAEHRFASSAASVLTQLTAWAAVKTTRAAGRKDNAQLEVRSQLIVIAFCPGFPGDRPNPEIPISADALHLSAIEIVKKRSETRLLYCYSIGYFFH